MPLRSSLKIHGVNGDADAFEQSFSVDGYDIGAPPSDTAQTFSFAVNELKTAAAMSCDIVSSDIVSSAALSAASATSASAAVPVAAVVLAKRSFCR